jgi:hypothetical protein
MVKDYLAEGSFWNTPKTFPSVSETYATYPCLGTTTFFPASLIFFKYSSTDDTSTRAHYEPTSAQKILNELSLAESCHHLIGCADSQFFFRSCALLNPYLIFRAFAIHPMFTIPSIAHNFSQQLHHPEHLKS